MTPYIPSRYGDSRYGDPRYRDPYYKQNIYRDGYPYSRDSYPSYSRYGNSSPDYGPRPSYGPSYQPKPILKKKSVRFVGGSKSKHVRKTQKHKRK